MNSTISSPQEAHTKLASSFIPSLSASRAEIALYPPFRARAWNDKSVDGRVSAFNTLRIWSRA